MTLLISLWLVLGALIILGLRPILGGWGTPALIAWPAYILLGLALAAASLKTALRPGAPPGLRSLRPLFLFALGGGFLFAIHPWLARYSDQQVFRARLRRDQTAYNGLLTQLPSDSASGPWRWYAHSRYWVDSGPPPRLAVAQPGLGYDGNEVALYDPVGRLDTVGVAAGLPRPFGGRIGRCSMVLPSWYRCVLHTRSR
jgi:hypothetical protein